MFDLNIASWILGCICAVMVGLSKCGVPGLGALAVPVMASVLPAKAATGAMLPMMVLGDMIGAWYFKRHADWKLLLRLLPISVAGIWLGYVLLGQPWMDDQVIRYTTACIVLVLVVMNMSRKMLNAFVSGADGAAWKMWSMVVFFGLLAGITTMLANAAGPVALIYLLAMGLPKESFIGTNAWFFVVLNWIKVPFMVFRGMINGDSLLFNAKLVPALLIGSLLGIFLSKRMSNERFKLYVQILTFIAGMLLFFPPGYLTGLLRTLWMGTPAP